MFSKNNKIQCKRYMAQARNRLKDWAAMDSAAMPARLITNAPVAQLHPPFLHGNGEEYIVDMQRPDEVLQLP